MAPKTYRLAPQLRRCCWYGLVAAPLLAAVVLAVGNPKQGLGPGEASGPAVILIGLAMPLLGPLTWRLRIDDRGLTRTLFGLKAFWPWGDFANGVIEKRAGGKLVHTGWRWWNPRRELTLPLASNDQKVVVAAINDHFRLPAAPEPPSSLSLRIGFIRVTLDANGVRVEGSRGHGVFLWTEVEVVDLERSDSKRHDFRRMRIVLPGRVLDFRHHQGKPIWRGAGADVLVALVARSVPPDRLLVAIDGEPLASRAQAELRAAEAERSAREFFWATVVIGLALAAFLAWLVWRDGFAKTAFMAAIMMLPIGTPYAWIHFSLRRRSAAWRRRLADETWRSKPQPDRSL